MELTESEIKAQSLKEMTEYLSAKGSGFVEDIQSQDLSIYSDPYMARYLNYLEMGNDVPPIGYLDYLGRGESDSERRNTNKTE